MCDDRMRLLEKEVIMKMRKFIKERIAAFKTRESQRGQILYMVPVIIIAVAAIIGAAVDGSIMITNNIMANNNAAIGCLEAADAHYRGGSYLDAFTQAMVNNNVPSSAYSPTVGEGADLVRGIHFQGNTFWVVLTGTNQTNFLRIIGIDETPVYGRARCKGPDAGLSPIAVKESVFHQDPPEGCPWMPDYPILGNEQVSPPENCINNWPLADEQSGDNFRGALIPHYRCKAGPSGVPPVEQCVYLYEPPYEPAPPDPGSTFQPYKYLAEGCMMGENCNIGYELQPVGTEGYVPVNLPIVDGTTSSGLCSAFLQAGHYVGELLVVLIFGGPDDDPNRGYVYAPDSGNRENVRLKYYAIYEITRFEQTDKNCNQMFAKPWGYTQGQNAENPGPWGPFYSLTEIPLDFKPREISWNYSGALP
jgi:hypothetical protein